MDQETPAKKTEADGNGAPAKKDWKLKKLPHAFNVRASDDEYRRLKKMAAGTGSSLSRLVIEGTLGKSLKTSEQAALEQRDVEQMIFELRRIGVNLSQITCALNAAGRGDKFSATEERLETAAAEVESIITVLKKKL